jgi:hypothetical protein
VSEQDLSQGPDIERVREACLNGQCGDLAMLISARTGWPTAVVVIDSTEPDGPPLLAAVHAVVLHPDGGVIDATGYHSDRRRYAIDYCASRGYLHGWETVTIEPHEAPHTEGVGVRVPIEDVAALAFDVIDALP